MKLFALSLLTIWSMQLNTDAELRVSISNINLVQGRIYVAIYDKEADFLITNKIREKKIVPVSSTGTVDISFSGLPPGNYAISCFHDVNGNGKLDTNFMGIPSEPYCFSNNARPKFMAPNWHETQFFLNNNGATQEIRLEK